jgi:hypothetical protein
LCPSAPIARPSIALPVLCVVLQPQLGVFGSWKTNPLCVGVSAKSMVTPSSKSRLSAGRKKVTPSFSTTASPARGPAATSNSAASPEQPPAVTASRSP